MSTRLIGQLLHRPAGLGVGEIVRHLAAMQAQDVPSARLAFRARSATLTVAGVEAAWAAREIVRTWGPRGTLHFIHVDDLPWLLALTVRRAGTMRRLAEEGVAGDDPLGMIEGALAGQGPLTKARLEERLKGRALGQGVVHLVALAASHGRAVLGPLSAGKPTYVHAGDWLGAPIAFEADRDRALREMGVRYRRAHADSGPEDLAAWSGLSLGDARAAWSGPGEVRAAWSGLGEVRAAGSGAGMGVDGEAGAGADGEVIVRLAPGFDEYLLGWKGRNLTPEHAGKVFPGGGILRPVVLVDGVIRGTWTRKGNAVTVDPFDDDLPDLQPEIDDVARFLR